MPGIVAHMVSAKLISDKLNIDSNDFYRGNLLPDIIEGDKTYSHYRVQGRWFHIPDPEKYKDTHDLDNYLNLGYYTHLLLDKYYMDEFIPDIVCNRDVFINGIYRDYDRSNDILIKKYNLDEDKILNILKFDDLDMNIDNERLDKNINYFKVKSEGELTYYTIDEFINFLEESSDKIYKILKK